MHTVSAPGKVNLVLEVGEKRPDGCHELATVFAALTLCDRITVRPTALPGTHIELTVTGANVPDGPENLVWRAVNKLAQAVGRQPAQVCITLEKRIPAAAGLGGGSSDAAAALQAVADLWGLHDAQLLHSIAGQLGADVPFFLLGGSALGRGRGELLTPLALPPLWVVLANPGVPCSTAAVYQRLDIERAGHAASHTAELGQRCTRFITALSAGPRAAGQFIYNDLAGPAQAVAPEIENLLAKMRTAGAIATNVSGSGASVFGLAESREQAEWIAGRLQGTTAWVWYGATTVADTGGQVQ